MSARTDGKHPLKRMYGLEFSDKDSQEIMPPPPKKTKTIPESISHILKNIESCISAVNHVAWGSATVLRNERACFFAYFNRITGEMEVKAESSHLSPILDSKILVSFTYISPEEVKMDRSSLVETLDKYKMGLSITAAKVLLVMEKLLSGCHTFGKEEVNTRESNDHTYEGNDNESTQDSWTLYSGSLDKNKLQLLVEDEKNKTIKDLWKSVNNRKVYHQSFMTDFLVNVQYASNPQDSNWNKEWKKKDISLGEIVVINRSDKTERFAKIEIVDEKKIKEDYLQVLVKIQKNSLNNYKEFQSDKLHLSILKRW